jgi:hypothetical protein
MMPISEMKLVRKALRNLFPAEALHKPRRLPRIATNTETWNLVTHHIPSSSRLTSTSATKGFGSSPTDAPRPPPKTFEKEEEEESDFASRPEYQIYNDPEFKPKKIINDVSIADLDGENKLGATLFVHE